MLETGAVIGRRGQVIYWHEPACRHSAALPDSQDLWSVFWDNRRLMVGFAHSHPGGGVPGPSHEDVTTFAAVEAALGRRLRWWIVSEDAMVVVSYRNSGYRVQRCTEPIPEWVHSLRSRSKMPAANGG